MSEFRVHTNAVVGPATHALVIGVGHYPHLVGGEGALYPDHSGMGQLSSPPISALRFATWLTESFRHPNKPLASVALLVSDEQPVAFTNPLDGTRHAVEKATFANVEEAVKAWKARADAHPEDLAIFYFCGHGIANGADLALLMSDFGADPASALESALDFRRFHLGMEQCKARQQCFFVDACRKGSPTIVEAAGYAGRPIFTPTTQRDRNNPARLKPIFYSTLAGEKSYAKRDEESRFTQCLLRALRGAGADNMEESWCVDTFQLGKALQQLMKHMKGFVQEQVSPVDDAALIDLHYLVDPPEVPVFVTCDPESHNAQAEMSCCTAGMAARSRPPSEEEWELDLPIGSYTFSAQFPNGHPPEAAKPDLEVRPPVRIVKLKVT